MPSTASCWCRRDPGAPAAAPGTVGFCSRIPWGRQLSQCLHAGSADCPLLYHSRAYLYPTKLLAFKSSEGKRVCHEGSPTPQRGVLGSRDQGGTQGSSTHPSECHQVFHPLNCTHLVLNNPKHPRLQWWLLAKALRATHPSPEVLHPGSALLQRTHTTPGLSFPSLGELHV